MRANRHDPAADCNRRWQKSAEAVDKVVSQLAGSASAGIAALLAMLRWHHVSTVKTKEAAEAASFMTCLR
jgi:hypothetical protein